MYVNIDYKRASIVAARDEMIEETKMILIYIYEFETSSECMCIYIIVVSYRIVDCWGGDGQTSSWLMTGGGL